jgi:hypothetical protein
MSVAIIGSKQPFYIHLVDRLGLHGPVSCQAGVNRALSE